MSTDREVARIVRSWLDDGVTTLPEGVLYQVLEQIPTTPQRRPWWPAWRVAPVNMPIRVALAAAAVVVAAVVGINLLTRPNIAVGPRGPSSAPPATGAASPIDLLPTLPAAGAVEPGRYRTFILDDELPKRWISFTVPAGWTAFENRAIQKHGGGPPAGMGIGAFVIANVYADPCHWDGTLPDPPVGPTVDDLVTALTRQPGRNASAPTAVTLDGFAGKLLRVSVPRDIDFADCDRAAYRSWVASTGWVRFHQGPGQVDELWILDVDGTRIVIGTAYFPGTTSADLAELHEIVESIRFFR